MKVAIVIHSVCGNGYLMAQAYAKTFQKLGHLVNLVRVKDEDWIEKSDTPSDAKMILQALQALPLSTPEMLIEADLILFGSPTYFGNVSAEMKAFMDQTGGLWFQGKLAGKHFAAFSSAGNGEGGGDLCLQAMHTYAKYMGMCCCSIPANLIKGESWPALGIIQYSNGRYATILETKVAVAISAHAEFLIKVCEKVC